MVAMFCFKVFMHFIQIVLICSLQLKSRRSLGMQKISWQQLREMMTSLRLRSSQLESIETESPLNDITSNDSNNDNLYSEVIDFWRQGFTTCREEVCVTLPLPNDFPTELNGTYFKNGYAKFEAGKESYFHPFDGDGMITAITVSNGTALFRNRFVRTKGYMKEMRANKILYRNVFGTERAGGPIANMFDTKIKNVANTNVVYWGKRLLALWEGSLPYRMEPDTLRTVGEYTFRGLLKQGQSFSAHPRIDRKNNRLVSFSVDTKPDKSSVIFYEFDTDLNLVKQRQIELKGFALFHDYVVTENYYILSQGPLIFKPLLDFIFGLKPIVDCIAFDASKPSIFYLVPRDETKPIQSIEVDPHFNFHFGNAFEDENGNVVADVVWTNQMYLGNKERSKAPQWKTIDYRKEVPSTQLMRYSFSRDKSTGNWQHKRETLTDKSIDFTSVNPINSCGKHRFVFGTVARPMGYNNPVSGLIKVDCETKQSTTWHGESYEFLGEPIATPRSDSAEDDVYIMSLLHNTKDLKTEFVIFNGQNISIGPISRLELPIYIPFGLHGSFSKDECYIPDEVLRRWKAINAVESKQWNQMTGGFSGLGIVYDFQ